MSTKKMLLIFSLSATQILFGSNWFEQDFRREVTVPCATICAAAIAYNCYITQSIAFIPLTTLISISEINWKMGESLEKYYEPMTFRANLIRAIAVTVNIFSINFFYDSPPHAYPFWQTHVAVGSILGIATYFCFCCWFGRYSRPNNNDMQKLD